MHLKQKDLPFEDALPRYIPSRRTVFDQTQVGTGAASLRSDFPNTGSQIHQGDARNLSFLPEASIDVIVTSPPYWLRRDYGHPEQLGQETTLQAYIEALVNILNGWSRLLRPHASVFLNLGDSYHKGFLVGIPARFELAAREAGWQVANNIVWAKSVGRPEPVAYRLASRHELIFHLTRARDAGDIYFDLYALAHDRGKAANPGDVWTGAEDSDSGRFVGVTSNPQQE